METDDPSLRVLSLAQHHAFSFLKNVDRASVGAMVDVQTLRQWATDGHKWLNVPFDCGYAFIADADAHRSSMSQHAAYITHH